MTATPAPGLPPDTPDTLPFREHIEGRLTRLAEEQRVWIAALREIYDQKIKALADLTEQRFLAQRDALDTALTAQKEAVTTALAAVARESEAHAQAHSREHHAQAEASAKSEKRADERFSEGNMFRQQIESERLTYVRRDMLDVMERNTRQAIEKNESDFRVRMEKMEDDARIRLEKVDGDLRQRIEVETAARMMADRPLLDWQQRSGGQVAVWIALGGVAITVILAVVIFLANWATQS